MSVGLPQPAPGADPRKFQFGQVWLLNGDAQFADATLYDNHSVRDERPVLVIQDGPLNEAWNYPMIRVAPITSEVRVKQPMDIRLDPASDGGVKWICYVRLGHVQAVLKNDLQHVLGSVCAETQKQVLAAELWSLGQLAL